MRQLFIEYHSTGQASILREFKDYDFIAYPNCRYRVGFKGLIDPCLVFGFFFRQGEEAAVLRWEYIFDFIEYDKASTSS